MSIDKTIDTAAQGAEVSAEVRIAELTAAINRREKVLALLSSMPEEDRSPESEKDEAKAIDTLRKQIAKIQFASVSGAVIEQGEQIAQSLQASLKEVMTMSEDQSAVVIITLYGKPDAEGKGYSVKFNLKDSSPDAVKSVSAEGGESTKKGTEIVFNGVTYSSAGKAAKAWHEANGVKFPDTSKNWLAWVKIHAVEKGFTYPDGSIPTKD